MREFSERMWKKYPFTNEVKMGIGEGWEKLIDEAFAGLQAALATQEGFRPNFAVTSVKEKFAGLRIYTNVPYETEDSPIDTVIAQAEVTASETCEYCGSQEEVEIEAPNGYWEKTICTVCLHLENVSK